MLSKVPRRAGWLLTGVILIQGGFLALGAQETPETPIKIAVVDLEQVFV